MTLWQYGKLALELAVGSLAIFVLMNTGDRDYFIWSDYVEFAVLTVALLWAVKYDFDLMQIDIEERRARRALAEQEYGEVKHPESVSSGASFLTELFSAISFDV